MQNQCSLKRTSEQHVRERHVRERHMALKRRNFILAVISSVAAAAAAAEPPRRPMKYRGYRRKRNAVAVGESTDIPFW